VTQLRLDPITGKPAILIDSSLLGHAQSNLQSSGDVNFPGHQEGDVRIFSQPFPRHIREFHRLTRVEQYAFIGTCSAALKAAEVQGCAIVGSSHRTSHKTSLTHLVDPYIAVLPALPPALKSKVEASEKYMQARGGCIFCDHVQREVAMGHRVVWRNQEYVAMINEAAAPYHVSIYPLVHQASFSQIKPEHIRSFADAWSAALLGMRRVLGKHAYSTYIHGAKGAFFHWHLDILPSVQPISSLELATGMPINESLSPERAAQALRRILEDVMKA
jgi:diadenosine tetraphosphate (Ap4A) HIT family hydrolase